jgi:hypothetical protein
MNDITHDYQAYMLRLWRTDYKSQWQWRASLESPHTGERQSFANLEQLFDFLSERCESQVGNKPEEGKEGQLEISSRSCSSRSN